MLSGCSGESGGPVGAAKVPILSRGEDFRSEQGNWRGSVGVPALPSGHKAGLGPQGLLGDPRLRSGKDRGRGRDPGRNRW